MSARLVELIVQPADVGAATAAMARHCRRFWPDTLADGPVRFSGVIAARHVERLLDDVATTLAGDGRYTAMVFPLATVRPALAAPPGIDTSLRPPSRLEIFFSRDRISTDELRDDIDDSIELRSAFVITVILSAIIAALGMRSGQTAVIIGAMVIAPLLGPTMALALAATIGDIRLAWRALLTLAVGTAAALVCSALLGMVISVDPAAPELQLRTIVQPADIALALAAGAAGVLALSRGTSMSLIGVMIAVALVPPLAACGMLLGSGHPDAALRALLLFATNLVCINVAGIATFLIRGLPPRNWRLTGGIALGWLALLLLLVALIAGVDPALAPVTGL